MFDRSDVDRQIFNAVWCFYWLYAEVILLKLLTYEQVLQRAIDYDAVMSKKGTSRRSFTLEQMAREIYQAQYPNHVRRPLLAESSVRYWKNALKIAPGLPKGSVSHGICKPCAIRVNKELDKIKPLKGDK